MKKSWRTSAGGVSLVLAAIASVVAALTDNDPAGPQWEICYTQFAAGIALLFARDNKVTSEDAGAKP